MWIWKRTGQIILELNRCRGEHEVGGNASNDDVPAEGKDQRKAQNNWTTIGMHEGQKLSRITKTESQ